MKKGIRVTVCCTWCKKEKELPARYVGKSTTNRFFCNNQCQGKWQATDGNPLRKNKVRSCLCCNKEIDVRKLQAPNQKFCSHRCYGNYVSLNPGSFQPVQEKQRVEKVCIYCDNKYEIHKYRKDASFFCSIGCKMSYGRITKECLGCGALFTFQKHRARTFCSKKCSDPYNIRRSVGEKELLQFVIDAGYDAQTQVAINYSDGFYKPDITVKNKIIEFYGIYWHCHESMFDDDDYNQSLHMTAKEKRAKDLHRTEELRSQGYEIMVVWEHEWVRDRMSTKENILAYLKDTE